MRASSAKATVSKRKLNAGDAQAEGEEADERAHRARTATIASQTPAQGPTPKWKNSPADAYAPRPT